MSKVADASAGGGSAVRFDWTGSLRLDVHPARGRRRHHPAPARRPVGEGAPPPPTRWPPTTRPSAAATRDEHVLDRADSFPTEALSAGSHSLEIRFTNDHVKWWPGGCDRNLYLDAVTFTATGATAAPRANPPVPAGFVHQSGTRLLDGAGKPIRLRGVNLGGWLLWEGWLWGQGFDYIGESAMMRNLASLVGGDAGRAVPQRRPHQLRHRRRLQGDVVVRAHRGARAVQLPAARGRRAAVHLQAARAGTSWTARSRPPRRTTSTSCWTCTPRRAARCTRS